MQGEGEGEPIFLSTWTGGSTINFLHLNFSIDQVERFECIVKIVVQFLINCIGVLNYYLMSCYIYWFFGDKKIFFLYVFFGRVGLNSFD